MILHSLAQFRALTFPQKKLITNMELTDFIATLALITSFVSLTYTIVVDRRRPKLRVTGSIAYLFTRTVSTVQQHDPYFSIHATNLGPGRVRVNGVGLSHRNTWKRLYRYYIKRDQRRAVMLDALPQSPDQLPKWLEVGESLNLFYPSDSEMLQENEVFDCFYLHDSIGGEHWAQKRVFEKARKAATHSDHG